MVVVGDSVGVVTGVVVALVVVGTVVDMQVSFSNITVAFLHIA